MRHALQVFKWLFMLAAVAGLAFFVYAVVKINRPATTTSQPADFEIKAGATTKQVAADLESQGIISRGFLFDMYIRFQGAENKLQAGLYSLDSNMTITKIVGILTQGEVKGSGERFTVIEGWRIEEIALSLEAKAFLKKEEFTEAVSKPSADLAAEFEFLETRAAHKSLEGFLFPDTYILKQGMSADEIARKMLQNFDAKFSQDLREEIAKQNRKLYDVLILASLVEREVGRNVARGTTLSQADRERIAEERRVVAGIFLNRLRIGMALESDASISYITGRRGPRATFEEIKIDSPYNTYKYRGLPPTPIANPSLDAIKAAINPADTDYLFFVTAPDGTAYFGKTLDEHIRNRQRYLE
ncbi:MAG: endolytic transglycosylase MltG [Candidatus Doudnabacteria bacterium]|nr:endolytic transglycosylase MltG [bacterium]MDZ4243918.1 endolytic transglycosylase MltG [Candidatus Doudnabacteria bacterium]